MSTMQLVFLVISVTITGLSSAQTYNPIYYIENKYNERVAQIHSEDDTRRLQNEIDRKCNQITVTNQKQYYACVRRVSEQQNTKQSRSFE